MGPRADPFIPEVHERNAFIEDLRALLGKHPWVVVAPPETPTSAETTGPAHPDNPGSAGRAAVPKAAGERIRALLSLSPDQVDAIMTLVSLPENGSSHWESYYNYIEWGDDHGSRGFTTTIFGATSGTGSLLRVFDHLVRISPTHPLLKYHTALKAAKGGNVKGLEGLAHVNGDHTNAKADYSKCTPNGRTHLDHIDGDLARLPNTDPAWREAVWAAFIELNWESAAHFCAKTGPCSGRPGPVLTTPLAKGWIVDCSLNHGDCRYWDEADTWKVVFRKMRAKNATDEVSWLRDMMNARRTVLRSGYESLDWSKTGDRCNLWLDLLQKKNYELGRPIHVVKSTATPYPIWQPGLKIV